MPVLYSVLWNLYLSVCPDGLVAQGTEKIDAPLYKQLRPCRDGVFELTFGTHFVGI